MLGKAILLHSTICVANCTVLISHTLKIISLLFGDISPSMFILTIINCIVPSRLLLSWCCPPVLGYILYRLFSHITITVKSYGFVIHLFDMYIIINQLTLTYFLFLLFLRPFLSWWPFQLYFIPMTALFTLFFLSSFCFLVPFWLFVLSI